MRKWIFLCALMISTFTAHAGSNFPTKPNPELTTGDYCEVSDPDFDSYRYTEQIAYCWRNVSRHRREQIYDMYGIPEKCRSEYTVDHFIPLAMGGSNEDANLWPEHRFVKATRQNLEVEMYNALKRGEVTRNQAVQAIVEAKMNPPRVRPSDCHLKERDLVAQSESH